MPRHLRALGLLLVAACIPNDAPAWVIDRPIAWGVIATVVQPGGYSSGVVVPDGQLRAEALPLDTLELQWLALAPAGTTVQPPIWFVQRDSFSYPRPFGEPGPCPVPLPLSRTEDCLLGEGERLQFALGGAYTATEDFRGQIRLAAIGSAGDEMAPADCLDAYHQRPQADLRDCLIISRTLLLGPLGQLVELAPAELLEFADLEIPLEALTEPPDTHPVLESFLVTRSSAGATAIAAADGDTVHVRVGERVTVTWQYTEASLQDFHNLENDPDSPSHLFLVERTEGIIEDVALSRYVDEFELTTDHRSWLAPDGPEPLIMHLYATDSRQGRLAASLRFVSDAP